MFAADSFKSDRILELHDHKRVVHNTFQVEE
jgi:hypothetical protein